MVRLNKLLVVTACAVLLTACGGGGDGEDEASTLNPVVLTPVAPVTPVTPQTPVASGLNQLLGAVSFNHIFLADLSSFTDTVTFDNSSFTADGETLIAETTSHDGAMGCRLLGAGFEFLCVNFFNVNGDEEIFIFDMNPDSTGTGVFAYCNSAVLAVDGACTTRLSNPDGPVDVNVGSVPAKQTNFTTNEIASLKQASNAQSGGQEAQNSEQAGADLSTLQADLAKLRSAVKQ